MTGPREDGWPSPIASQEGPAAPGRASRGDAALRGQQLDRVLGGCVRGWQRTPPPKKKGGIDTVQSQVPPFSARTPRPAGESPPGKVSLSQMSTARCRGSPRRCQRRAGGPGTRSISRQPPAPPPPRRSPPSPVCPRGGGALPGAPLGMSPLRAGNYASVLAGRAPRRALPPPSRRCPGGWPGTLRGTGVPLLLSDPWQPPTPRPPAVRGVSGWEGRSRSLPGLPAVFHLELN